VDKTDEPNGKNSGGALVEVNSGPTGPRTPKGKERSKLNAITHGIFSKVVVLKTESQVEYDSLLQGLREACKPQGTLEEILVDKLTTILWRYRRLINAESGEVSENLSSIDRADVRAREREPLDSECQKRLLHYDGVAGMTYDPEILGFFLNTLINVQDRIKAYGFESGAELMLREIYGWNRRRDFADNPPKYSSGPDSKRNLLDRYIIWRDGEMSEELQKKGYATPDRRREKFLAELHKEIDRLQGILNALKAAKAEQTQLEELRRSIPESDRIERLLRYEASLERAFDRTLVQLERLQRMRLGQPVTPPIKVEITS